MKYEPRKIAKALRELNCFVERRPLGLFVIHRDGLAEQTIRRIVHAYGGSIRFDRDFLGHAESGLIKEKRS